MARKKKVEEVVEKVVEVVSPTIKRPRKKKIETEIIPIPVEEIIVPKKRTRKSKEVIEPVIESDSNPKNSKSKIFPIETVVEKKEEKPKRVRKTKEENVVKETKQSKKKKVEEPKPVVIINEVPKKRTKKSSTENMSKLSSTPPPPQPKENPKPKVQKSPESKKSKKSFLNIKDYYEFEEGKYVLGDVDELFDENLAKKIKTSLKLSKKNHVKDDKFGIHFFKVGDKVWDMIDYNNKILTSNNSLIICKSETITKEGKLRFCRRFEARSKFRIYVDYTDLDYCLYFMNEDDPSPFMMLQNDAAI